MGEADGWFEIYFLGPGKMASTADVAACTPIPTTSTAAETAVSAMERMLHPLKHKMRSKVVNRINGFEH